MIFRHSTLHVPIFFYAVVILKWLGTIAGAYLIRAHDTCCGSHPSCSCSTDQYDRNVRRGYTVFIGWANPQLEAPTRRWSGQCHRQR